MEEGDTGDEHEPDKDHQVDLLIDNVDCKSEQLLTGSSSFNIYFSNSFNYIKNADLKKVNIYETVTKLPISITSIHPNIHHGLSSSLVHLVNPDDTPDRNPAYHALHDRDEGPVVLCLHPDNHL